MSDIPPRFIRVGKAPAYLAMCRRVFDKEIRPLLREISIGKQGIAFDRKELDQVADEYAERMAIDKAAPAGNDAQRSERRHSQGASNLWGKKQSPGSRSKKGSGTSTRSSTGMAEFEAALAQVYAQKQSNSSLRASSKPKPPKPSSRISERPSETQRPAT
ncbi:hypothetical protein [Achromobacter insolitus]|uniref:hypothetical protein n=1 Tax=Achromobacter insolitus TaxID=217204 RepID=UPI00241C6EB6|nr:hypothetical protein [Achromobacter insolitus]